MDEGSQDDMTIIDRGHFCLGISSSSPRISRSCHNDWQLLAIDPFAQIIPYPLRSTQRLQRPPYLHSNLTSLSLPFIITSSKALAASPTLHSRPTPAEVSAPLPAARSSAATPWEHNPHPRHNGLLSPSNSRPTTTLPRTTNFRFILALHVQRILILTTKTYPAVLSVYDLIIQMPRTLSPIHLSRVDQRIFTFEARCGPCSKDWIRMSGHDLGAACSKAFMERCKLDCELNTDKASGSNIEKKPQKVGWSGSGRVARRVLRPMNLHLVINYLGTLLAPYTGVLTPNISAQFAREKKRFRSCSGRCAKATASETAVTKFSVLKSLIACPK